MVKEITLYDLWQNVREIDELEQLNKNLDRLESEIEQYEDAVAEKKLGARVYELQIESIQHIITKLTKDDETTSLTEKGPTHSC